MKNTPLPTFLFEDLLALHAPAIGPLLMNRERLMGNLPEAQSKIADYFAPFVIQRRPMSGADGIANIHINDALAHNTTELDRALGMTDYAQLIADLNAAAADPKILGIHLDINSPGGSAVGAPEAAAAVAAARLQKPVAAHIGVMGASAAYYIAAACTAITVSQSAVVGSIGTISSYLDYAGMLAQRGITPHIITPEAADLKATGNQFRAPTEKETEFLKHRAEILNADFTGWVKQYREADPASMRGQWFSGKEAVANGLADYLGTFAESVASLRALL